MIKGCRTQRTQTATVNPHPQSWRGCFFMAGFQFATSTPRSVSIDLKMSSWQNAWSNHADFFWGRLWPKGTNARKIKPKSKTSSLLIGPTRNLGRLLFVGEALHKTQQVSKGPGFIADNWGGRCKPLALCIFRISSWSASMHGTALRPATATFFRRGSRLPRWLGHSHSSWQQLLQALLPQSPSFCLQVAAGTGEGGCGCFRCCPKPASNPPSYWKWLASASGDDMAAGFATGFFTQTTFCSQDLRKQLQKPCAYGLSTCNPGHTCLK